MIERWLALDIGTTGVKAALLDSDRHAIQSSYRAYETQSGEGGVVEQRAADWWIAVIEAAHELDTGSARAIALTGQMQDVILLDAQHEAVRPVILYSDTRAYREAEEVREQIGVERLSRLTGNAQDAGGLLAKLRWLSRYEAESVRRARHLLLGAADFVALKMTDIPATDSTTASTTGLLDLSTRAPLASDVFAELDLAFVTGLLPAVQRGGARVGALSQNAAQTLRLAAGIPVYHGPGDAGATTLGAGSGEPGQVYAYVGTSGWVAFTSERRTEPDTGAFTLAHPHPEKFICVAPLLTAGGNLDWVRDLFGVEIHAELIGEALNQPPTHLLYLPYLNGERSPFNDPFARGAFIGLNPRHTRADLCRAVLEGVVYAYRHALDALISEPINGLTLTGGGSRSEAWCQLFADIRGVPVVLADDATNVGVRGAVLAAEVAMDRYQSYAPPGFFPTAAVLQPDMTWRAHYDRQYKLFRAAYPALKPIFAEMR